jgi:hypothetical protein
VKTSSWKVPVILAGFLQNLNFLNRISKKKVQISGFIKIRPVGAELFHAGGGGGRTDMTKPIVAFRNFANAPKQAVRMY